MTTGNHFGRFRRWGSANSLGLFIVVFIAAVSACSQRIQLPGFVDDDAGTPDATTPPTFPTDGGLGIDGADIPDTPFDVQPAAQQTLSVTFGQLTPTVGYTATANGSPINVAWSVDRIDVGKVDVGPASSTTFTPMGTAGGIVTIKARLGKRSVTRTILINMSAGTQNGPNTSPGEAGQVATSTGQLGSGGGIGGVGGEGLGGAVTDPGTLSALQNPSSDGQASGLKFLYPYDATVWPRGMLAPLMMWTWTPGDADAIQLSLTSSSGTFSWTGTFGRPAVLGSKGAFIRHPIPQDIWDAATKTAGGSINGTRDRLKVSLTIAKGGQGYGPISETWDVAPAFLTGTVYYGSYGTRLVANWGKDKGNNAIGAAILSIRSGDTSPKVAAGQSSSDFAGCRVCHVVSSRGNTMVVESSDPSETDRHSHLYDLTNPTPVDTSLANQGVFTWAALTSDGSYALTNTVNPTASAPAISETTSTFWKFGAAPQQQPLVGLPLGLAAGYPSFSPDDKYVAYIDVTGSTGDVHGPIVKADYNTGTHAFSNVTSLYSPPPNQRVGFPVFVPDNSGIVFETSLRDGKYCPQEGVGTEPVLVTRCGARGELWWINTGTNPTPTKLSKLNGTGYIPTGPNNHGSTVASDPTLLASDPNDTADNSSTDDSTLNYEPTVLPVAAGGYAWVVFTSRRMYGNQLTTFPFNTWQNSYDNADLRLGTTKKLWVAAVDLNAPAGSDPSHPAFYLPAQEITAGNSRGYWALDPCKADGQSCASGDQCCNGYCEPGSGGTLVCGSNTATCAGVSEKCGSSADCCDPSNDCINGFCAVKPVK
jgi:hypothetical protein